ncbi:MAG: ABC transporter ATP-binding protein [Holosporales bacterium]|nr:ABC transporter ATP-binding protein [Holosporales bacterium]
MASMALSIRNVKKTFIQSGNSLEVLKGVDFDLFPRDIVALTGASGTGKTTLLQIMGLIDSPTEGEVTVAGTTFSCKNNATLRDKFRRNFIGFVYQYHHLLSELTALENVMLPQLILGKPRTEAKDKARDLLRDMNLEHRTHHFPSQLSGGEQQRVAIARALINDPQIILADEPTGNLDDYTARHVFEVLLNLTQQKNIAAVVATHNMELVPLMSRHVELRLGGLA